MDNFTFITNNCLGGMIIYPRINREFDNPFMGSYIIDDDQYLKLCMNFDYYMSLEPVFSNNKLPMDITSPIKPGTFPVMFLDDIEIHWIHETDEKVCLEKYKRRVERMRKKIPFFIWGDSLLHRPHTDEERLSIIRKFNTLENRIYFNKDSIIEWKDKSFDDRHDYGGHAKPLNWLDWNFLFTLFYDIYNKYSDNNKYSNI